MKMEKILFSFSLFAILFLTSNGDEKFGGGFMGEFFKRFPNSPFLGKSIELDMELSDGGNGVSARTASNSYESHPDNLQLGKISIFFFTPNQWAVKRSKKTFLKTKKSESFFSLPKSCFYLFLLQRAIATRFLCQISCEKREMKNNVSGSSQLRKKVGREKKKFHLIELLVVLLAKCRHRLIRPSMR